MKRWKKIVLLIFSFNILFFSVESQRKKAEAFVVTSSMVALGALAIVAAGGVMYSTGLAERIGQNIKLSLPSVDDSVVTGFGGLKINMTPALQTAMSQAVAGERSKIVRYEKTIVPENSISFGASQQYNLGSYSVKEGDIVRVEFDTLQVIRQNTSISFVGFSITSGSKRLSQLVPFLSGNYSNVVLDFSITRPASFINLTSSYYAEVEGVKFTVLPSPEVQKDVDSFSAIPNNYESINGSISNSLVSGKNYTVSNTHSIEGATSLSDLETGIGAVNESVGTSNNWLSNIYNTLQSFVVSIPSSTANFFKPMFDTINNTMSGLWEDAGLVWSGIKDAVNATNNWLNNVLAGALDGLSNGIDNLTRVFQETWAGIEAGLANIANKIGAGVSTGVADLTGVIDKIGSIPMDLIGLIIPSDWSGITERVDSLMFNVAENPFKEFMDSLSAVFAKRKSIFDLRVTYYGKVYPLVPLVLKPALDTARTFLTGAVMLVSLTLVYVRAKGISWWK